MRSSVWLRRGAVVVACLGATATVGVASAAAATKVPGENIYGMGSSLQAIAQTDQSAAGVTSSGQPCGTSGWDGWVSVWSCTAADHTTLNNDPQAFYTTESSGQGLAEFGDAASAACTSSAGTLNPDCDPGANANGELDTFIGTDDPPNSADLSNAETAAGNGVQEVTIPIAQAPVAMIFSLPSGITLNASQNLKLTTSILANLWGSNGVAQSSRCTNDPSSDPGTWCDLFEAAGLVRVTTAPKSGQFEDTYSAAGSEPTFTLMERSKGSGTTYSFRGWLYEADQDSGLSDYPYNLVSDGPADWPSTAETQSQSGPLGANGSGSSLVENTTETPGSTGYANLADAALDPVQPYTAKPVSTTAGGTESHQVLFAEVQDNTGDGNAPNYASPASGVGTVNIYTGADISENPTTCTPPSTARVVGCWVVPGSPEGAWSSTNSARPGTIPSDPDVYDHGATGAASGFSKTYPILAVTYDVAWTEYDNTGSNLIGVFNDPSCPSGTNCNTDAGNSTKSYLTYVVGAGQGNLSSGKVYYGKLASAIDTKAKAAVAAINP